MGSRAPVLLSACSWRVPWDWWWHANISSGVFWIWTWLYASRKKTTAGLPEFLASISSSFSSCRILPVPTHIPQKIRSFSFQMCEMANRNGKRRKGKKRYSRRKSSSLQESGFANLALDILGWLVDLQLRLCDALLSIFLIACTLGSCFCALWKGQVSSI